MEENSGKKYPSEISKSRNSLLFMEELFQDIPDIDNLFQTWNVEICTTEKENPKGEFPAVYGGNFCLY